MDEQTLKTLVALCAIWGAGISTILGAVKLWESFWKDRIRLATTYSFTGQEGASDKITIVNLSAVPVQVSHWTLAWKPNLFHRKLSVIDVTPVEGTPMFTIPPRNSHTLNFEEQSKFDWGYRSAHHRQLFLTLHIFGQKSKVLKICAGQ
jgi:hypothetical protein